MAKKRKNRRNPAASARAASERVTYGGVAASSRAASAKAASARPVAKPPVDMPLPASAKKKSKAPLILASVFGVAVVGGVAWWLLSKKASAAEGEFEPSERMWSDLSSEEKSAVFQRQALMQKRIAPVFTPFNKKERESEKAKAEAQGLVYLRTKGTYVSPDVADQLIATGDFKYDKNGVVVRAHLQSLSDASRSILASL